MKHLEDNLQIACVNYFHMQYPHFIIHHSANGGKRTMRINNKGQKYCSEGSRFKKMGVVAGFPDLMIITNKKIFFVELKSQKQKLNENQKIIHEKLNKLEQKVYICYLIEEFIAICKKEIQFNEL